MRGRERGEWSLAVSLMERLYTKGILGLVSINIVPSPPEETTAPVCERWIRAKIP